MSVNETMDNEAIVADDSVLTQQHTEASTNITSIDAQALDDPQSTKSDNDHLSVIEEIPEDFVYDDNDPSLNLPYGDNELSRLCAKLHGSLGFPIQKRSNMHILHEPDTLLFTTGNSVVLHPLNSDASKRRLLCGHRKEVSCLTIHPSGHCFAVGESGAADPCIFVYSWPELRVLRVLCKGSERAYSDVVFNAAGDQLASVGSAPDYLLIVWDWKQEHIVLHTKAFSQEIFRVNFSPHEQGTLVTSGTGHIRFWKMANTFTGLKLQGKIGKFGTLELTDVATAVQLPDGKVISSTETGTLLVWDDNVISFALRRLEPPSHSSPKIMEEDNSTILHDDNDDESTHDENEAVETIISDHLCHEGAIEYLKLFGDNAMMSAGTDGFIRVWNTTSFKFADVPEEDPYMRLEPWRSYSLGSDNAVLGLTKVTSTEFVVQSRNGIISKVVLDNLDLLESESVAESQTIDCNLSPILDFHSGAIRALAMSPSEHEAITGGSDSSVRCWDLIQHHCKFLRRFAHAGAVTALEWAPQSLDSNENIVFAAFEDGVVRVLYRHTDSFSLVVVAKPHVTPIISMAVSPDGEVLATSGLDQTVFFLGVKSIKPEDKNTNCEVASIALSPIALVDITEGVPISLSWRHDSELISMGAGSIVVQISRPIADEFDTTSSFRTKIMYKTFSCALQHLVSPMKRQKIRAEAKSQMQAEELAIGEKDTLNAHNTSTEQPSDLAVEDPPNTESISIKSTLSKDGDDMIAEGPKEETSSSNSFSSPNVSCVLHSEGAKMFVCYDGEFGPLVIEIDEKQKISQEIELTGQGVVTCMTMSQGTCDQVSELNIAQSDGTIELHEISERISYAVSVSTNSSVYSNYSSALRSPGDQVEQSDQTATRKRRNFDLPNFEVLCARTFDNTMLVVATPDGSLDVYRVSLQRALKFKSQNVADDELILEGEDELVGCLPHPIEKLDGSKGSVDQSNDILTFEAYSIEEEKLQAERDNEIANAKTKKQNILKRVSQLCTHFNELIKRNSLQPSHLQIESKVLQIDDTLAQRIESHSTQLVKQARLELAWQQEKCSLALRKISERFVKHVLVEQIELHSIRGAYSVSSFRTAELSITLKESIAKVHKLIEEQAQCWQHSHEELSSQDKEMIQENSGTKDGLLDWEKEDAAEAHDHAEDNEGRMRIISLDDKIAQRQSTSASRRHQRQMRAERRAELEQCKPTEAAEDLDEIEKIRLARTHMGDFKLKSDKNYIVPDDQRVNADQKRRQMLLMLESLQLICMGFNERFLALRDLKQRLANNVWRDNARIREINSELGRDKIDLFEPQLLDSEWPERLEQYDENDLMEFAKKMRRRKLEEARAKKGGANAFGGGEDNNEDETQNDMEKIVNVKDSHDVEVPSISSSDLLTSKEKGTKRTLDVNSVTKEGEDVHYQENSAVTMSAEEVAHRQAIRLHAQSIVSVSPMQKRREKMRRLLLENECTKLICKVNSTIDTFDKAIEDLRKEKLLLDTDLHCSALKMKTLYQELSLLKAYEPREAALSSQLHKARADKAQVVLDLTDCQESLSARLLEITAWQEKDKEIISDFESLVGGTKHPNYAALHKIFKKKVKRVKKKPLDELSVDDDTVDESDESQYESDDVGEDSESDQNDEEDLCPLDCDVKVYEKVLELREKRLDQEETLVEFNQAVDELKTQNERHQNKERSIDRELRATENSIQAFHTEKQQALNCITVAVPLRLTQFQCLTEERNLPTELSNVLVFTRQTLDRLHHRIEELNLEKHELRNEYSNLKREHKILTRELRTKRTKITAQRKKCEEVQLLKFGRLIDLDKLDSASTNSTTDKLRGRLTDLEHHWSHELSVLTREIASAQRQRTSVIAKNTRKLHKIALLTQRQHELEDQLNGAAESVHVVDGKLSMRQDAQERLRLVKLVRNQSDEIENLKAQVMVLQRKGGYLNGFIPIKSESSSNSHKPHRLRGEQS